MWARGRVGVGVRSGGLQAGPQPWADSVQPRHQLLDEGRGRPWSEGRRNPRRERRGAERRPVVT